MSILDQYGREIERTRTRRVIGFNASDEREIDVEGSAHCSAGHRIEGQHAGYWNWTGVSGFQEPFAKVKP